MNANVIDEFRANQGKVGGGFSHLPILLLTTRGAKSGRAHTTPLAYLKEGARVFVFASQGGAPKHPSWYHNLVANPDVSVEIGDDKYEAKAAPIGAERDEVYARQVAAFPQFGDYEKRTTRRIP